MTTDAVRAGLASPEGLRRRVTPRLLADYSIVLVVVLLFGVLAVSTEAFLTTDNLLNILDQNAPLGIAACGTTLVIIAGGFDLSTGAVYALAGVVAAWVALHVDPVAGLAAGVLLGAVAGVINGLLVTVVKINSFLATLASALAFRGVAVAITGGFILTVEASSFTNFGGGEIGGVKHSVWLWIVVAVVLQVVLARTRFGRHVYAVGGSPEAARLSGIRVDRVRVATFVIGGACAALAGVILVSQVTTAQSDIGVGLELNAIAAVVLGGASIAGGIGAVWRTALGVLLLALVTNGFNILDVEPFYQDIAKALIIVFAVALNSLAGRR
jgi:ribose transport system permease protein